MELGSAEGDQRQPGGDHELPPQEEDQGCQEDGSRGVSLKPIIQSKTVENNGKASKPEHTSYLSRAYERGSCKFFLAGVNFYRFNAKNWQFTVYFAVITQKIGNLLCILS